MFSFIVVRRFRIEDCPEIDFKNTSYVIHQGDGIVQDYTPRVFCIILTTPSAWETKGRAVRDTWAKRCDDYCFFFSGASGRTISSSDACQLKTAEGKKHLTGKVIESLNYTVNKYGGAFDWYLKADDDTYMILENLRTMLAMFNASKDHYLGHRLTHECKRLPRGHNSGGAGYILSRRTASRLLQALRDRSPYCRRDGEVEDLDIATCLASQGVYPENTLDEDGRTTFHPEKLPINIFKTAKWFQNSEKGTILKVCIMRVNYPF